MKPALAAIWSIYASAVAQTAGSLAGAVTETVTRQPVPAAEVSLTGPGGSKTAVTDERGQYSFDGLQPGNYRLRVNAWKAGYAFKSVFTRVRAEPTAKRADVTLDKLGVLEGQVLDRDKNPVVGAMVSARSFGYRGGRRLLSSFHSARTTDLGEFRIERLMAERYYLVVEPKPLQIRKRLPGGNRDFEERKPVIANVRTYYPNSSTPEGAAMVALGIAEQREGLEITLLRERTVCVASSLVDTGPEPSPSLGLMLSELYPNSQSRIATGTIRPGDEFEVCGVPPASYRLWSFTTDSAGRTRMASELFAVADRAVRVPTLYLKPLASLSGEAMIEGARPEDPFPAGFYVSLTPKDRINIAGEETSTKVLESGSFTIQAVVAPDEYWVWLLRLPAGFFVKEVKAGGRDVWREPLRTGSGSLRVLLGANGPRVAGHVLDKEGLPVPDAAVVLAAVPLPAQIAPNELLTTATDQDGAFSFHGMPPGDYRLLAFTGLSQDKAGDPDFVRSTWTKAVDLSLAAKEVKTVRILPVDPNRY
ncbi:MAG: carboxypeptidase regulatory-like domain-containing protein [Acidobacteria bacterium]|nr:carboxypeptidase regulatory-like domain-containing protein [Acidobacteriota bacterium]